MNTKEIKYITNKESLILLGALFLLYGILGTYFYRYVEKGVMSNHIIIWSVIIVTIILHLTPFSVAIKVSKGLNRNYYLWGFFCYIFPFIGLVILSKLDYNFSPEYKRMAKEIIGRYKIELKYLQTDLRRKKIDYKEYKIKRLVIEMEFNNELKLSINRLAYDKGRNIIDRKEVRIDDNYEKIKFEFCPACNYKLEKNDIECLDCGLNLE